MTSTRLLAATAALAAAFAADHAAAQNQAKVCFYDQPNYRGASYCAAPGFDTADADRITIDGKAQNWNKRFQSIQIQGEAKVTVWEGKNFTGPSIRLNRSEPDLSRVQTTQHGVRNWSKAISSYKTHF